MSEDKAIPDDPLVELFIDLAKIRSPSGDERLVVDYLIRRLEKLGLNPVESEPLTGGNAGNLYCRIDGDSSGTAVLFSGHTDTIVAESGAIPEPKIADGVISCANRAVLGADDKAALAAIVSAVERIVSENLPHAGIELLLTVSEENGLKGSKAASLEGVRAECGFCLDSTGPVGEVIVRSPAQKTIRATFIGKSAHAGVAPEEGRSAVVAASKAVSGMKLGRIDDDVVPEKCYIAGECRSHKPDKLDSQVTAMMEAVNEAAAAEQVDVDLSVVDEFQAFDLRRGNLPVDIARRALGQIGITPVMADTGGGSDVNEFNRKGLPSVNLSVGMTRVHSPDEYITVESLIQARDLVLAIVSTACGK
jgi:tripeptide aminopeptidase